MRVVYLSTDLLFGSRVSAAAKQGHHDLITCSSMQAAVQQMTEGSIDLAIFDLNSPEAREWSDWLAAQTQLEQIPRSIAYGPHVHREVLQQARNVFDQVMSQGQFDEWLRRGML